MKPPKKSAPPDFSGGATLCGLIANGLRMLTGRFLAADDHDFRAFFFRLSDQHGDHGAKANTEKRKNDQRENKHSDERTAVTESLGQLLTIDDADIARRHLS